jgi:putative flippase GtrA
MLNGVVPHDVVKRWTVFNLVGAGGVAVQVGLIACLVRVCGWHYLSATALAVEAAVLHNFAWHQRWTWKDRPPGSLRETGSRFVRFQILNGAISLAGNLVLMSLLTGLLHVDPVPANVAAIAGCAALNFAASEVMVFRSVVVVLLMVLVGGSTPAEAQSPEAIAGWDRYQSSLDARYRSDASSRTFFVHDREGSQPGWRNTVRAGGVSVFQIDAPAVADARIHHWAGAVFIPGLAVHDLITRLQQAAGHESDFYDDVVASRLLGRDGDRLRIFMKLRRTALVTVTYNTEHAVEYRRLGDARFSARSTATRIVELADAGTAHEREKTAGDDNGFLWRLGAYWRYEAWAGGVIVECESVSLSRPVPFLLRPIAGPVVDRIARESLERTLRSLRTMAAPRT